MVPPSGKYLAETATEVLVELKPPPQKLFADSSPATGRANICAFAYHPARPSRSPLGSSAREKSSWATSESSTVRGTAGRGSAIRTAFNRRDGCDGALFTREDAIEAAWAVVNPVLKNITGFVLTSGIAGGRKRLTRLSLPDGGWHNPISRAIMMMAC